MRLKAISPNDKAVVKLNTNGNQCKHNIKDPSDPNQQHTTHSAKTN